MENLQCLGAFVLYVLALLWVALAIGVGLVVLALASDDEISFSLLDSLVTWSLLGGLFVLVPAFVFAAVDWALKGRFSHLSDYGLYFVGAAVVFAGFVGVGMLFTWLVD
jgi:hypothetical protein